MFVGPCIIVIAEE